MTMSVLGEGGEEDNGNESTNFSFSYNCIKIKITIAHVPHQKSIFCCELTNTSNTCNYWEKKLWRGYFSCYIIPNFANNISTLSNSR
jgi:hypothetical protein